MKKEYNPLKYILLVILLASVTFYIMGSRKTTYAKRLAQEYTTLNKAHIKGVVEKTGVALGIYFFKVTNNSHKFIINPDVNENGQYFITFVDEGDSIIKPAYSQQLIVKKKNSIVYYNFEKYR